MDDRMPERNNSIEIYRTSDNQAEVEVKFDMDTVWLNQYQMAELFETDRTSILKHIKNIYDTAELDEQPTCAKFAQVREEGKRSVERKILHYNLDVIISVGYRVNSKRGVQFRQWATQRIHDYLIKGYAINEKRLIEKNKEIRVLKDGISILNRALEKEMEKGQNPWLIPFAKGLKLLDDYDHLKLDSEGRTRKQAVYPEFDEYTEMIHIMFYDQKSDIFAVPKDESFHSSINQIRQSFNGIELYPTIEEKAATLLYLVVKNHSFVDGNKRIAAACFLLFLDKNGMLNCYDKPLLSYEALASLTLFVAVSNPSESDTVKQLIISVLNRNQNVDG